MLGRQVTAPDGTRWRVRRLWLDLRRPRWRGRDPGFDGLDGAGDLPVIGAVIALILLTLLVVFVVLPLLIFAVELAVLLVVALAGVVGRVALGRPWRVQAKAAGRGRRRLIWEVPGFRRSGEVADGVAQSLAAGLPPPPAGPLP